MNLFLNSVEFTSNVNPIKSGFKVDFTKSICVLVGDNGVGKSTILESLADHFGFKDDTYMKRNSLKKNIVVNSNGEFPFKYIDFHGGDKKFSGSFGDDMMLQIAQMRASSGQVNLSLLGRSKFNEFSNGLVILDEPCRGLSLKNQAGVSNLVRNLAFIKGCQVILTTHSDVILRKLNGFAQYFSVEKMCDITYEDYVSSQNIN
jgi:predicted ATPase